MSRFQIEQAVRQGNKARVAIAGPAGSGKTFTALTLAVELADGGEVLVIDTERGSASLYADLFTFKTIRWEPPYDPRELGQEVTSAAGSFAVVVVDSLTHFWTGEGGTLAIVDQASLKAQGNKFVGWNTGTPAQDAMVAAMLNAPCHVLATMRSKMEYVQEKDDKGKTQIRRVGMAPVQRDGLEYEFTVTADIDIDHRLSIGKTRCSALSDALFEPGDAGRMGKVLKEWLDGAQPIVPKPGEAKWVDLGWADQAAEVAWRESYTARAKNLSADDKREFKKDAEGAGLVWKAPIPKSVADDIDKLFAVYLTPDLSQPSEAPQEPTTATEDAPSNPCPACGSLNLPGVSCDCEPF